ncbi:cytochrome P450 [Mycena capillaripes]|nr:cytochrome P450 [Mycena capillaripes]
MRPLIKSGSALAVLWLVYTLYRRWTRISISDIPGPEPESFLLGSQREALQCQADFKWQAQFCHLIRLKGILGVALTVLLADFGVQKEWFNRRQCPPLFTRYLLDVIGEAQASLTVPGKTAIFIMGFLELLPASLCNGRRVARLVKAIAKELVDEKAEALLAGKSKRDIISLLVKANASANERTNLSEAEVLSQIQTIMMAGHETTANTMSWTLFELTKNPDVQAKLRAEIQATERAIHARGDTEFTAADFESMVYTTAVMKEVFRFHPVSYTSLREAARDEVLPLSKPLVTKTGKTITELPIAKNTVLVVSLAGYNRNTDVFGEDAHKFNPERWLDGSLQDKATTKLGVYGNLMTFGSGHRACIGWRFAVYEYQAFLVELVKNFEFSMDPTLASKVRREASLVMLPTIAGEVELGPQLPVTIKAIDSL